MAVRRAFADEYAVRVNRAVELLAEVSAADAVRALQGEYGLSERQARRYVNTARAMPDGLAVPERSVMFTVRLAPSLITRLRAVARSRGMSLSATVAEAVERYLGHVERHGGSAG
jgi:predicted DNA-binding transcriptional regulator YafY